MNLLEQQAANRRRTWIVMFLFVVLLIFLGMGFDLFFLDIGALPVPIGSMLGLGIGSVSALAGYYGGDRAVLLSSGAVAIDGAMEEAASDAERLKIKQLDNVVDEMAIAAGLPRPRVYVVPDADPNAFATGRDPDHASLAVTRGLVDMLDREELQAVVSHEMSHIRNYDVRLLTIVAALVGAVVLLSDWAARGMRFGGARRRGRDGSRGGGSAIFFVVWIVGMILAPIVAQVLAMAVSRRREYLADASGAELTRNPGALASALEKIESAAAPTAAIKRGTAHLCISDPLGRAVGLREGFWADLWATHPPMAKRIAALRQMAYQ